MEQRQARLLAATEAASRAPQEASSLQMTALPFSHSADFLLYSSLILYYILSFPIAFPHFSTFKFVVWLHRWNGSLTAPHEHFQHGR